MKTVDALIAARDFFVAHPDQWARGSLHNVKNGKDCFCALGGISTATGCMDPDGFIRQNVVVSCTAGPIGIFKGGHVHTTDQLSNRELATFAHNGVHLAAAVGAVRYANAAAKKLTGEFGIMHVNDSLGYNSVVACLNLAIKNAKRRHITGDRKKSVQANA